MDSGVVRQASDRALWMLDLGSGTTQDSQNRPREVGDLSYQNLPKPSVGSSSQNLLKVSTQQAPPLQPRHPATKWLQPSYVPSLIYRRPKQNDTKSSISTRLLSPNSITRQAKMIGSVLQSNNQTPNHITANDGGYWSSPESVAASKLHQNHPHQLPILHNPRAESTSPGRYSQPGLNATRYHYPHPVVTHNPQLNWHPPPALPRRSIQRDQLGLRSHLPMQNIHDPLAANTPLQAQADIYSRNQNPVVGRSKSSGDGVAYAYGTGNHSYGKPSSQPQRRTQSFDHGLSSFKFEGIRDPQRVQSNQLPFSRSRRVSQQNAQLNNPYISPTVAPPSEASSSAPGLPSNVRVVARIRPLLEPEKARNYSIAVQSSANDTVTVEYQERRKGREGLKRKEYKLDWVFDKSSSQMDIFEHSGTKKLIDAAIMGYSTTAFVYGQTGSGKTYTISGLNERVGEEIDADRPSAGLVTRSISYLCKEMQRLEEIDNLRFRLRASMLEIYNEHPRDLLNSESNNTLGVRWKESLGFHVEGQYIIDCDGEQDALAVFAEGLKNRAKGSHALNEDSSRSHSMITLYVDRTTPDPYSGNDIVTYGKITFVDLAGSERLKDSGTTTQKALKETSSINRSLFLLSHVISVLGDINTGVVPKTTHVPYRDSVLTKLLQDSLGGDGMTLMIGTVNPALRFAEETMSTLSYACRARNIKNKPTVKIDPKDKVIKALLAEISKLKNENQVLRTKRVGSSRSVDFTSAIGPRLGWLEGENMRLREESYKANQHLNHVMEENNQLVENIERLETIFSISGSSINSPHMVKRLHGVSLSSRTRL